MYRSKGLYVTGAVLVTLWCASFAAAKPNQTTKKAGSEDSRVDTSRKNNEEAQAEYYRELTRKLREPSPTPVASPAASIRQTFSQNPGIILGVMGAIAASFVAFISFIFNYRTTLRNQTDTQFYEALKRFGDKDSPAIRSSAAGLLSQMGRKRLGVRRQRHYLRTALDQLIAGHLIDENSAVLTSISEALKQLAPLDPRWTLDRMYKSNIRLQADLVEVLSDYLSTNDFHPKEGVPEWLATVSDKVWTRVETLTGYSKTVIISLIEEHKTRFVALIENYSLISEEEKPTGTRRNSVGGQMSTAAQRLQVNTEVSSLLLTHLGGLKRMNLMQSLKFAVVSLPWMLSPRNYIKLLRHNRLRWQLNAGSDNERQIAGQEKMREEFNVLNEELSLQLMKKEARDLNREFYGIYDEMFLVGAALKYADLSFVYLKHAHVQHSNLSRCNLRNVNLSAARLNSADLSFCILSGVSLRGASLEGAVFKNAKFHDTSFYGATIDAKTDFEGADWWKASFLDEERKSTDLELLEKLYKRYKTALLLKAADFHYSAHNYLTSRMEQDGPKSP